MDQERIEVVEVAAQLEEAGRERPDFPVAVEEGGAEGAEQVEKASSISGSAK